jgi:hypothetical protein
MPRPSHSSWFDHPNNIWWGVRVISLIYEYKKSKNSLISMHRKVPKSVYSIIKDL